MKELDAFRSVDFSWVRALQSVWHDPPFHIDALHERIIDDLLEDYLKLTRANVLTTEGRVVVGPAGVGKTHLIGTLRRRVWDEQGWFVLLDIVGITDFWRTAALGFINSLQQTMPDGQAQHTHVFLRVLRNLPPEAIRSVAKEIGGVERGNSIRTADLLTGLLQAVYPADAARHRDIVRAFVLLRDPDTFNAAYSWLQGLDLEPEERHELHFAGPPPAPTEMVRGMSWFMGLAGPILVAVDQLDAIVTATNLTAGITSDSENDAERKARAIIETLAGGLMDIKDVAGRSLTVVTCLPETWNVLKSRALQAAEQRFVPATALENAKDSSIQRRLIADRLEATYREREFVPPYPTWPFRPEALDEAVGMPPRQVLMRCDAHRRRSIAEGTVRECLSLPGRSAASA